MYDAHFPCGNRSAGGTVTSGVLIEGSWCCVLGECVVYIKGKKTRNILLRITKEGFQARSGEQKRKGEVPGTERMLPGRSAGFRTGEKRVCMVF